MLSCRFCRTKVLLPYHLVVLLVLAVWPLCAHADGDGARWGLGGCVIKGNAPDCATGIYGISFNPSADGLGTLSPFTLAEEALATGGGVMKEGVYYCTCLEEIWTGFYYVTGFAFDGETWEQLEAFDLGTDLSFVATDMTYDATTGKIYGCFYDGSFGGFEFGTMEYGTAPDYVSRRETIARLDVGLRAIAASKDGVLWAVDYEGRLVTVDKETGAVTVIDTNITFGCARHSSSKLGSVLAGTNVGDTGLKSEAAASAAIEPATGLMYMTLLDGDGSRLYCVDLNSLPSFARLSDSEEFSTLNSQLSTLVCRFGHGEQITGLFTYDTAVREKPAVASSMDVAFSGNALSGQLAFVAPTQNVGGGELQGDLDFTVTANGVKLAEGKTKPGQKNVIELKVAEAGEYEFALALGNAFGTGRSVSKSVYVGDDAPQAVTNVVLVHEAGLMSLSWDAPSGVHGGYVDAAGVRYDIVRVCGADEERVATGLAANSYSEAFVEPSVRSTVKYSVTATYCGFSSQAAWSNAVLVGTSEISLPYVEEFEAESVLDDFTVIDANNDGRSWHLADGCVRIDCNERMAMDDWLITPPIRLEAGKSYRLSCTLSTYNSPYFPERMEIRAATQPTVEAMRAGAQLMYPSELKNLDHASIGGSFVPTTDGSYCFGLHGMSDADMFFIIIDRLTIEEGTYDGLPDVPERVGELHIEEIAEGRVRLSWAAPTCDVGGRPIDSALTYRLLDARYNTVAEGLDDTEYCISVVEPGEQDITYYYIAAENEVGTSEFVRSDMIAVGTPYGYPYAESFDNGASGSIFAIENPEGSSAEWEVYTEESGNIADADGSNGFIGMYGYRAGDSSSLYSGKISLEGAVRPALSFYYNALSADNLNTMEVAVREAGARDWTVLADFAEDGASEDYEWIRKQLPLDGFTGKTIQLRWTARVANYPYGLIDGIAVGESVAHDLAVANVAAPSTVNANSLFELCVTIANEGADVAEGYSVELYRDGVKVQEIAGNPLAGGERRRVAFTEQLGVSVREASYSAAVVYELDENSRNDVSRTAVVGVRWPNYPTVTDLMAEYEDGRVRLSWSAPDVSDQAKAAVTEDFEGCEAFAQDVDGWLLIDGDEARTGGISGVTLPFDHCSWFVVDSGLPGFGSSFASHSGTRHVSTMFNYNGEQNDDWMISPELSGEAQSVSLWARSYVADYGLETMQLLYSTSDREQSSFELVQEVELPAEWTELTFDLPDGARYFAIRCISADVYMLFVDDVTYTPSDADAQSYSIIGYNLYRDGVRINEKLLGETEYCDLPTAGEHKYAVSVVYAQGESALSNEVEVDISDKISSTQLHTPRPTLYTIDGRVLRRATSWKQDFSSAKRSGSATIKIF